MLIYFDITCCIGVRVLKELPKDCERAVILGEYILENKSTVRACAKQFGISKSTVHTVVTKRVACFGLLNYNYK